MSIALDLPHSYTPTTAQLRSPTESAICALTFQFKDRLLDLHISRRTSVTKRFIAFSQIVVGALARLMHASYRLPFIRFDFNSGLRSFYDYSFFDSSYSGALNDKRVFVRGYAPHSPHKTIPLSIVVCLGQHDRIDLTSWLRRWSCWPKT